MNKKVQKWYELSRKIAFEKYSRNIERVMFRLPDGKETDFYIKKEDPAAVVLAMTRDNKVIVAKQYRQGPKEILLELPRDLLIQTKNQKKQWNENYLKKQVTR
ncbi:MAG: hypothetical protein N2558_03870 [Patescibacteria group bacterium]|nr:hypothetical protein [Patescibacteria group bacterium]